MTHLTMTMRGKIDNQSTPLNAKNRASIALSIFFLSLISLILIIFPSIMLGGPGPEDILDSLILSFVGQDVWDRVDWGENQGEWEDMYVCMYIFSFTISYNNFNFK